FGCRLLAVDIEENPECLALGVSYTPLADMLSQADIVSLHCPLTPATRHIINTDCLALMKSGLTLLNTSRGGLLDTRAVIAALVTGHIGLLGLDVYEEGEDMFFRDLSDTLMQADVFARRMTSPNVMVTSRQAFFTREAVSSIAATTLANISAFANAENLTNR